MSWRYKEKNGCRIYYCEELNHPNLIQAVSTRDFGNMALHTGDTQEQVVRNRQFFLESVGLDLDHLVAGQQAHGTQVLAVNKDRAGTGARSFEEAFSDTDALITKERGVILSIFTADCLPIFIYDPITPAVGIIHAGWRGTIAQIVISVIDEMIRRFNTDPVRCMAAMGPAICSGCFQVKPDVAERFAKLNPDTVIKWDEGYSVDLCRFNLDLMEKTGIQSEMIHPADSCSSCQVQNFYSYRAENGTKGRMMGIIALQ